jgi:hypothetical protein
MNAIVTRLRSQPAGKILLVHGQQKSMRHLVQILRSIVGQEVELRERLGDALADSKQYGLVIVDYEALLPEDRDQLLSTQKKSHSEPRLLVLSGTSARADFANLFGTGVLTNLLARDEVIDAWDMLVTLRKLLRRDIFGLEKYFAWGVEPQVMHVKSSSDKPALIEAAQSYADSIGVDRRLAQHFCTVADEFFTNAIFNAPVDADGKSRFGHCAREDEVTLGPNEAVEVKFSCDGFRLGISIADPFGSLSPQRLLFYLSKCFRKEADQVDDKLGGAGLGLYFVFECLTHFVVNIQPGRRTEMIGLIDVRGTFRDFAERSKSFNVFVVD